MISTAFELMLGKCSEFKQACPTRTNIFSRQGGPYISHIHALTYAGANSPGPGTYDNKTGKGHYRTLGDCPLSVFGSEARNKLEKELEASRGVPGPGAYMIRESSGAPCYSMAANLRTDFTQVSSG